MPPIFKKGFKPIKKLGSGGEGEAWLAYQVNSRKNVVIKVRHTRNTPKEISNEINLSLGLMKSLPQCPNLCAVFDYDLTSTQASIVIEYCDGGDLTHLLHDTRNLGTIPRSFVSHAMVHLGAALVWLHTGFGYHLNGGYSDHDFEYVGGDKSWNPVYHRDIKPDNILVRMAGKFDRKTPYPDIVLADFGFGATKYSYMSPWKGKECVEAVRFKNFTDRTYGPPEYSDNNGDDYQHLSARSSYDIWQFGAVLYELTTGKELRKTINTMGSSQVYEYVNHDYTWINEAIKNMIRTHHNDRATDDQIKMCIPNWKHSRDKHWQEESHRWFDLALGRLVNTSGPPAPTQRTNGIKKVVPKEQPGLLKRVASRLRR